MFCLAYAVVMLQTTLSTATTNCTRSYEFLGLTRCDNLVVWLAQRLAGECQSSNLIVIQVLGDTGSARTMFIGDEAQSGFAKTALAQFPGESSSLKVELIDDWIPLDSTLSIKHPTARELALDSMEHVFDSTYDNHAWIWSKYAGNTAIDQPWIKGGELKLISYDPNGLYLDYRFKEVFYFPESRLLLIFTNQPRIASGLDQMHGYLLFRVVRQ